MCQTSSKGMICRKNDGTTPTPDAGTPTPDTGGTPGNDTTAPTVTISSPTPNAQVSSSTTVKAAATDNVGVTSVELLVDNVSMASKSTPPFDFPIILQNGSHTLTVVAYDKAQNKGQSSVSVTVGSGTQPDTGTAPPPPTPDTGTTPAPKQDSGVPPPQPGGNNPFGNGCNQAEDCLTKLCAFDPAINVKYCSQQCGVQDWCPPGGVCVQGSGSGAKLCALPLNNNNNPKDTDPAAAGGCSLGAGAASAGSLGLVMLGLLALLTRRRRK